MKTVPYEELDELAKKALAAAEAAMEHAYNPYSHFYVGAALFTEDGTIIPGTNYESATYTSICAERTAIVSANTMGIRRFQGIVVIARGEDYATTEVTTPCGSCRQMLYEVAQLSGTDLSVILSTTHQDKIVLTTIKELLPLGFGPTDLQIDLQKYR
jgi:cytidine deaminase